MSEVYDLIDNNLESADPHIKRCAYLKIHAFDSVLFTPFFSEANKLPVLNWKRYKFTEANKQKIPDEKGVYAFAVEVRHTNLPKNVYIMYVGKAGDTTSENTLRKRYPNYLRYQKKNERPKVREMLNLWRDHLYYYYAVVPAGVSTGEVEKLLTQIFLPHCNSNDFVADTKELLKGAGLL